MEFKGIVIDVQDKSGTSKKTGEAFNACQFVVEEQADRYPQSAVFDMFGDRSPRTSCWRGGTVSGMKASEWNGSILAKTTFGKLNRLIRIFKKYLWVIHCNRNQQSNTGVPHLRMLNACHRDWFAFLK